MQFLTTDQPFRLYLQTRSNTKCWGPNDGALRRPLPRVRPSPLFHHAGVQPLTDQPQHWPVSDPFSHEPHQPVPVDRIEKRPNVRIQDPFDFPPLDPVGQGIQRVMRLPSGPEPVAEPGKLRLDNLRQELVHHRLLYNLVLQCGDPERSCPSVRLGDSHPPDGRRSARTPVHAAVQFLQSLFPLRPVLLPPYPVDPRGGVLPQPDVGATQGLDGDVVQ